MEEPSLTDLARIREQAVPKDPVSPAVGDANVGDAAHVGVAACDHSPPLAGRVGNAHR